MFRTKSFLIKCFVNSIFVVLLAGFAEPKNNSTIRGKPARLNQFPFEASIRAKGCHICGSAIISKNFVLTAGHCVARANKGVVTVYRATIFSIRAGSTDLLSRDVARQVSGIRLHPLFNKYYNYTLPNGTVNPIILHDLALLQLQEPLVFNSQVSSIRLGNYDLPFKSTVTICGWGKVRNNGKNLTQHLKYTKMWTLRRIASYALHGMEASRFILDLRTYKRRGTCAGDSGGPAIFNNSLVGIYSFGGSNCEDRRPDSYVRIRRYHDWIKLNSDYSEQEENRSKDSLKDKNSSKRKRPSKDEDESKDKNSSKRKKPSKKEK